MPYLPLNIPPGIYKNGTELQASGRWSNTHLVRFHEGTIQPHKGWRNRSDNPTPYPIRGLIGWKSNNGSRYIVGGTYEKLYVWQPNGDIFDITPSGFGTGQLNSNALVGYGSGLYGSSTYGTARSLNQQNTNNIVLQPSTAWTLSTWGEHLIANSLDDGKVYQWTLNTSSSATVLSNAPTQVRAICVDDQRFLWAFQSREVYWSDQENNNVWASTATNQAGNITLQTTGRIVCAEKIRGGILILTTDDAHSTQYIGQPYIHSIQRVGLSCGIISSMASVSIDIGVIWMSDLGFFRFAGGQVQEIPCEVSDFVFKNLNTSQKSKCCAVSNASFNEVLFFYPSGDNIENDSYVSWNYQSNTWSVGNIGRSSGIDVGTFALPVYVANEYSFQFTGTINPTVQINDIINNGSGATAKVLAIDISGAKTKLSVEITNGTFTNNASVNNANGTTIGTLQSQGHFLQEHETGSNYSLSLEPFIESGAIQLGNGDQVMSVTQVIPDELTLGSVTANFKTKFYPTSTETDHGNVTLTNPTSVRFQGREVKMKLTNNTNDWRVGAFRLNAVASGKR